MSTKTMNNTATLKALKRATTGLVAALAFSVGLTALPEEAQAQEILLTGPLAGAPAVRKLRLYRKGRLQLTPSATFTVLDEYQRTILPGLELQYNFTDWLSLGAWGAYSPDALHLSTGLTKDIQDVNQKRNCARNRDDIDCRLTDVNMGSDFEQQLGQIDWVAAPQLTGVPFRGKLALFKSIYVDTEIYFFAGAAFVGLQERKDCEGGDECTADPELASRTAIAPTGGLGFSFFTGGWGGLQLQYRLMPFAWNTGGFDTAGGGPDSDFPDGKVNSEDRQYRFNQLVTVGWTFFLPTKQRVSE
jgi:hypothetical protein